VPLVHTHTAHTRLGAGLDRRPLRLLLPSADSLPADSTPRAHPPRRMLESPGGPTHKMSRGPAMGSLRSRGSLTATMRRRPTCLDRRARSLSRSLQPLVYRTFDRRFRPRIWLSLVELDRSVTRTCRRDYGELRVNSIRDLNTSINFRHERCKDEYSEKGRDADPRRKFRQWTHAPIRESRHPSPAGVGSRQRSAVAPGLWQTRSS
jgi:hypothetical protein